MFDKSLKLIENGTGTAFPCAAVAIGLGYNVFARSIYYTLIFVKSQI